MYTYLLLFRLCHNAQRFIFNLKANTQLHFQCHCLLHLSHGVVTLPSCCIPSSLHYPSCIPQHKGLSYHMVVTLQYAGRYIDGNMTATRRQHDGIMTATRQQHDNRTDLTLLSVHGHVLLIGLSVAEPPRAHRTLAAHLLLPFLTITAGGLFL